MASASRKTPPKPVETSAPAAAPAGHADFRAEIEKSRAMIQDADTAPQPAPAKNKGGRPRKEEVEAREAALKAARIDDLNRVLPPASLKAVIALPFDLAAMGTGFQGWQLSDEEADAIVPSLHEVMKTYAPAVDPEKLGLLTLAGAILSVGLGKYIAFLQFRAKEGASQPESGAGDSRAPAPDVPPAKEGGFLLPAGVHIP